MRFTTLLLLLICTSIHLYSQVVKWPVGFFENLDFTTLDAPMVVTTDNFGGVRAYYQVNPNESISIGRFFLFDEKEILSDRISIGDGRFAEHISDNLLTIIYSSNIATRPVPTFRLNLVQYDISTRQLLDSTAITIESFDISGEIELVPHTCGGYWIVTHDANGLEYYSFRLSSQLELSREPVVSQVGIDRTAYPSRRKFSLIPSRNLILVSALDIDVPSIEVLSVNPSNGRLSLSADISYPPDFAGFVEPSLDGQLLYAHLRSQGSPNVRILQYDISVIDRQIIQNSELMLASPEGGGTQDITTGPDNKIYINEDELVISVINNPNERGINADYEPDRFTANFAQYLFLPHHFRVDMIRPPTMDISAVSFDDPLCSPSVTELYNSLPEGTLFVNDRIVDDISMFQLDTGLNQLRIVDDLCISMDSLFFNPVTIDVLPQDTLICPAESLFIDLSEFESVLWSDNTADKLRSIPEGIFDVIVVDRFNCVFTDTITISQADPIADILPPDTTICGEVDLMIDLSNFSSVIWSDGSDELIRLFTDTDTGIWTVDIIDDTGCGYTDTIMISSIDVTDLFPPSITLDCQDGLLTTQLNLPQDASDILWSTGDIAPAVTITEPMVISVEANLSTCIVRDTIAIIEPISPCINPTVPDSDCSVYIPNAISTQSTLGNDLFIPVSDCDLFDFSMEIYDRWGGRIFQSSQLEQSWDGRSFDGELVQSGVYTYAVRYTTGNSTAVTHNSGTLFLVR
jgi:hypothetical protein